MFLWSGKQSRVYSYWKNKVIKYGKRFRSYSSLSWTVLPKVYKKTRDYMITERVKRYQDMTFFERKKIRVLENEFSRERRYLQNKDKRSWWKKFLNPTPRIYKSHSRPLFQKYGWSKLLRFPLWNIHWRDIRRDNLGMRRWKPVILDEWIIRYK